MAPLRFAPSICPGRLAHIPWRCAAALGLLLGALLLAGCAQGPLPPTQPPSRPPTRVETPAPLEFQLARPIGSQTSLQAQAPFTVTLENCAGGQPRTQTFTETLSLPLDGAVRLPSPPEGLQAEAGVIAAAARSLYGLDRERTIEERLEAVAPPAGRAVYRAHWEEVWDENTLQVHRGEEIIETIPLSALIGARLVTEAVITETCPSRGTGGAGLAGDAQTAAALVRAYLERLSQEDYEGAYTLLAADYRRRVPFDRYLEGYEPVAEIAVEDVQTTHVEPTYAVVEAHLTVGLRRQGQIVSAPWLATYYLVRQMGGDPWEWAIADVIMLPTSPMGMP